MDGDRYLSDDDENYWRPPPIPSEQITQGASARLLPTVQQLPDPMARRHAYWISDSERTVDPDRYEERFQEYRRKVGNLDTDSEAQLLMSKSSFTPNTSSDSCSSQLSSNYIRHQGQSYVSDGGTNFYVDQWGNTYTHRPPPIRSSRNGRTIYRWCSDQDKYILEPSSGFTSMTDSSSYSSSDNPPEKHPPIRCSRNGRTFYCWCSDQDKYIFEPSSGFTNMTDSSSNESGPNIPPVPRLMSTKDGRIIRQKY